MVKLFKALYAQEIENKINNFIEQNRTYIIDNIGIYPMDANNKRDPKYMAYIEYCRNREEEFNLWKK